MAYNNVNKRIVNLAKAGLLEETKIGESIHGRKDYKLTMKGLSELIPHILAHPEEVKNIVRYIDQFGLDKESFEEILLDKIGSSLTMLSLYLTSVYRASFRVRLDKAEKRSTAKLSYNNEDEIYAFVNESIHRFKQSVKGLKEAEQMTTKEPATTRIRKKESK